VKAALYSALYFGTVGLDKLFDALKAFHLPGFGLVDRFEKPFRVGWGTQEMNQLQKRREFAGIDQSHRRLASAFNDDRLECFSSFIENSGQISAQAGV